MSCAGCIGVAPSVRASRADRARLCARAVDFDKRPATRVDKWNHWRPCRIGRSYGPIAGRGGVCAIRCNRPRDEPTADDRVHVARRTRRPRTPRSHITPPVTTGFGLQAVGRGEQDRMGRKMRQGRRHWPGAEPPVIARQPPLRGLPGRWSTAGAARGAPDRGDGHRCTGSTAAGPHHFASAGLSPQRPEAGQPAASASRELPLRGVAACRPSYDRQLSLLLIAICAMRCNSRVRERGRL